MTTSRTQQDMARATQLQLQGRIAEAIAAYRRLLKNDATLAPARLSTGLAA